MVSNRKCPTSNNLEYKYNFNFFGQNVRIIWKRKPANLLSKVRRVVAANKCNTLRNILPQPLNYFYSAHNQCTIDTLILAKILRFSKLWARQLKNVNILSTVRFISYVTRTATYTQQLNCLVSLPHRRQNNNTLYSRLISLI